jgi:hypothetical protein
MPRVAFEPTILVFMRAKKIHALGRVATVIGLYFIRVVKEGKLSL